MDDKERVKFNWVAFLLNGAAYYAGYGKVKKGFLLAVLGFLPLTVFIVNIYAGVKANKELPVKKIQFHWGRAMGVFVLNCTVLALSAVFISNLVASVKGTSSVNPVLMQSANAQETTQSSILDLFSGVWQIDETGEAVIINLLADAKLIQIDQTLILVEVESVDIKNGVVHLIAGTNRAPWRVKQVMSEDGKEFTLSLFITEGSEYQLSYLGDLNALIQLN